MKILEVLAKGLIQVTQLFMYENLIPGNTKGDKILK